MMHCDHSRTLLDYFTALGPLLVAAVVAWVAYRQYRTNADKLRLDLYDRRFSVYLAALDFYYVLLRFDKANSEHAAAERAFIKAARESRFLFGLDSEPVRMLEEIRVRANTVTAFAKIGEEMRQASPKIYAEMFEKQQANLIWIGGEEGLLELERTLAPFLDFRHAAT